jgi:hypothetical protein
VRFLGSTTSNHTLGRGAAYPTYTPPEPGRFHQVLPEFLLATKANRRVGSVSVS